MTDRFFDCEYRPGEGFVLRFRAPKTGGIATEARAHGREAVKEGLLAVRSLLDAVIEVVGVVSDPVGEIHHLPLQGGIVKTFLL